ncbi:MAG: dihydrodipicolinate synthase family protein [Rhodospirillaceae bacterium]
MTSKSPLDGGVMAAVLTPLDRFLTPDPEMWLDHCRSLIAGGCTGLAVLGTTSEANSFTVPERLALLDALGASDIDAGLAVPGVGCCAIPDTVALCRKSVEIGAAGVLMLPPFYYKPVTDEGLFAAYSEIVQRVGDRRLKILLYHIPQNSGVPITLTLIEKLVSAYPDTFVGIKDSAGDFANMKAMVEAFPGFSVFSGSDSHLLGLLRIGGAGSITACNNIAARQSADVYAHWRDAGADDYQQALGAIRAAVQKFPLVEALKEAMARATGNPAWRTLRPPLMPLPEETAEALWRELAGAGFPADLAA